MKRISYITKAAPSPTNLGGGQRSNLNLQALPESGEVDCILIGRPSFITDEHLEISRDDYGMIAPSYFVPSLAQKAPSCSFTCPKGTQFSHPPLRSGQTADGLPSAHCRASLVTLHYVPGKPPTVYLCALPRFVPHQLCWSLPLPLGAAVTPTPSVHSGAAGNH
jgi:hypothetical protein